MAKCTSDFRPPPFLPPTLLWPPQQGPPAKMEGPLYGISTAAAGWCEDERVLASLYAFPHCPASHLHTSEDVRLLCR